MHALYFFLALALNIFANNSFAEVMNEPLSTQALPQKEVPVTIEGFEAETQDQGSTLITVTLSGKPHIADIKLEDHGTFLQILLPDAVISKPGEFVDATTPYINKMVGFQTHPETVSLRFFVTKEASIIKQASKLEVLDSHIILTVNHAKVEELLKSDPTLTAQNKNTRTADDVIKNTSVDKDIPEPAALLKKIDLQDQSAAPVTIAKEVSFKDVSFMNDRFVKATIFCGIMLLGLLGVYILKPRLRKLRKMPENYQEYAMRTLATHKVSPKQRIELFDIGGEKILLAIGPDQVNFLTMIAHQTPTRKEPMQVMGATSKAALPKAAQPANQVMNHVQTPQTQKPARRIVTPTPAAPSHARSVAISDRQTTTATTRPRIETRVGDEIKIDYSRPKGQDNQAISDVTRLIREKLKNLPSI